MDLQRLDLPPLTAELESFLSNPHNLPLHEPRRLQRLWMREVSPNSLFTTSLSDVHSTIVVERDPATGKLLEFNEVDVSGVGLTAKNSTSLLRAPGPPSLTVKGDPTNYPFWPGGMDHLEIVQNLESDASDAGLDFSSNLLKVPPGFSEGLATENSDKPMSQEPVAVTDLLFGDDLAVLNWTEQERQDTVEPQPSDGVESPSPTVPADEQIDVLLTADTKDVPRHSEGKSLSQWAVKVDVNALVEDFDRRVPNMAHTWGFSLDNFQKQAIIHLESHDNVFIAAHTSAGKTVVAEYAIALSKNHMTRAIYTSPIKALSNQKFRDFRLTFGCEGVGLLTGDVQINTTASCLIMTTEILRSMLYNGSDVIRDVEWVIFDEVHYVNDSERGVVWEEVLIMLPDHVSIIMLSATVPNAMEFADWVGRTKRKNVYVISTLKRPVPLKHYLYTGNSKQTSDQLFEIVGENKKFNKIGYQLALDAKKQQRTSKAAANSGPKFKQSSFAKQDKNVWLSLIHMLGKKSLLPVVAFTFSRNRCNDNANSLSSLDLTTTNEKSAIHVFFQKSISILKGCDKELPQVIWTRELLKRGIAVHHSGILPIIKEVIELLFQRGLVKLLFATETFAMGVNMPARTVVFDSTRKHDGVRMRDLHTGEYIQMAGRAGRRGLDPTGTVILMCKADVPEASDLNRMILGQPTTLESQFRLTYSMLLNLMRVETLRVEDMMKRSFAETDSAKHEVDRKQALADLQREISDIQGRESCLVCDADIAQYYSSCATLSTLDSQMKVILLFSPNTWKALSVGRVVMLCSPVYGHCLAVVLQQNVSTKPVKTLSLLVLCEPGIDDEVATASLFPADSVASVQPYTSCKELFSPSGVLSHTVVEVPASMLVSITTSVLEVEGRIIFDEFKRRLMPRFREYPLQPATIKARQELLQLVVDNSDDLPLCFDPMRDLKINNMEYVELREKRVSLESTMTSYDCVRCPSFKRHFAHMKKKATLKEKLLNLEFKLSESSLQLLPDYKQRLKVLRKRGYTDENNTVQLKGKVTCELNSREVLLTELIFKNVFMDYSPAETAALLSAVVFQQAKCSEPSLTDRLQKGKETILRIARELAETERDCGIDTSLDDYERSLKFGLVEVVYEWANGKEFLHITQITDVLEGMIVRCIQRLDETCKDIRKAAKVIGDLVLFQKMQDASNLIKRDIVFAASLYTI